MKCNPMGRWLIQSVAVKCVSSDEISALLQVLGGQGL
jgi:hypothetical protein